MSKADPATGPLTARLERQALGKLDPKNQLLGRVVGPRGQPVAQAKVEPSALHTEGGGTSYGALEGIDPVAMTDTNGEFVLVSKKPFFALSVTVVAPGLAQGRFQELKSGHQHELRLLTGNAVAGRLVANGQPVAQATVGLMGVNRSMEQSIGNYVALTDAQGRFLFRNIPVGADCHLYSLMCEARANGGVAPVRKFRTGAEGATNDLGDLRIQPAFRVAGKVVLSDGKSLPSGLRAMLGREDAWDTLPNVDLGPDGSFEFEGVPAESVGLSLNIPGYRFSLLNPSLDRLNGFSLVGRVSGNLEGLVILQEPGQFKHDWNRPFNPDDQPRGKPLRGLPPDQVPRR